MVAVRVEAIRTIYVFSCSPEQNAPDAFCGYCLF